LEEQNQTLDINNPDQEIEMLTEKFLRLHSRFLAVAMDYKFYINSSISDYEIYKLRDNVIFRLHSARFHFELLLQYHDVVESNMKEIYKSQHPMLNGGPELVMYQRQAAEEIYSLFDSLIYHLCSIFDYLFRLINFIHGKTNLINPKWNLFKSDKNIKHNLYCSKEMIDALEILDQRFVYPLIKHRSHLIHTEFAIGGLQLVLNDLQTRFLATKTLKDHFPEIEKQFGNQEITINFAAKWLIDEAFKSITEVLFELREDMKRNKKVSMPLFITLGPNNTVQETSIHHWGDRNIV
jgi:hypothetical protein